MININLITKIVIGLLAGFFLSVSYAQSPITWEQLDADEQKILTAYKKDWSTISEEDQVRLRQIAHNWQKMPPTQRTLIQQGAEQWDKMPEKEKEKIRNRYQAFKNISPEQKQRIIQRMATFNALPENERQALRQRWLQQLQKRKESREKSRSTEDKKVTSVNPVKNTEESKTGDQVDGSTDSRLDNTNRTVNNRLDTPRINRPTGRTR